MGNLDGLCRPKDFFYSIYDDDNDLDQCQTSISVCSKGLLFVKIRDSK